MPQPGTISSNRTGHLRFCAVNEAEVVGIWLNETNDGTLVQFEMSSEDMVDVVPLQDKFGLDIDTLIANETILI